MTFEATWTDPDVRHKLRCLRQQFRNLDPDEVESELMLAVWKAPSSHQAGGQSLANHVYTAGWFRLTKLARATGRRRARERLADVGLEALAEPAAQAGWAREQLLNLPKKVRRAVWRRVVLGYTLEELARAENCSEHAAARRVGRGLELLKGVLDGDGK